MDLDVFGSKGERPTGLTKDVDWELGARRTFDVDAAKLWRFLTSSRGSRLFVGSDHGLTPNGSSGGSATAATTAAHAGGRGPDTASGVVGSSAISYQITTYVEGSHIRMRWIDAHLIRPSMVQIRVAAQKNGKATLSILQDHLTSGGLRETMLGYWKAVLDKVSEALK